MSTQTNLDPAAESRSTGENNSGVKPLSLAVDEVSRAMEQFIAVGSLELKCHVQSAPGQVPDLTLQFFGPDSGVLAENDRLLVWALGCLAVAIRTDDS